MRILCLNSKHQLTPSLAEIFLKFTPRLALRSPHWLFMEISSTNELLGGEKKILHEVLELAERFIGPSQAAVSDTPYGAEVFTFYHREIISAPRRETFDMESLPIDSLVYLRGLEEVASLSALDDIIALLKRLGLKKIRDLQSIPVNSWSQRWGEVGARIWQRLQSKEEQVISFFEPTEEFYAYAHFEQNIALHTHLLVEIKKSLELLLARLEARGRIVQDLKIELTCEYSDTKHSYSVSPATACNDLELILRLLELRFENLTLENPVREYEIFISDTEAKKMVQLDLLNVDAAPRDRLERLTSLLKQVEVPSGFLTTLPHLLPERAFCFKDSEIKLHSRAPPVEKTTCGARLEREVHSQSLNKSPRPSLLLEKPQKLSAQQVRKLQFLTRFPIERIEDLWWDDEQRRDYYIGRSPQGNWVWFFQDLNSKSYFLHGYFD